MISRSGLFDYSHTYITVKGTITATRGNVNVYDQKLSFKNNALFASCITKINNTLIDKAEDLNIVMLMYNLFEYRNNYSKTSSTLWNYYKDEPNSGLGGVNNYIRQVLQED